LVQEFRDKSKRGEKHLEDVTQKTVAHIDEILKHKEAELLEV
jgi:ribosome recycling factor